MKPWACLAISMVLLVGASAAAAESTREFTWSGNRHPEARPPCAPDEYEGQASIATEPLGRGGHRVTRLSVRLESRLLRKGKGFAAVTVFVGKPGKKPHGEVELVPLGDPYDPVAMRTGQVILPRGTVIDVQKGETLLFQSTGSIDVGGTPCPMPVAYAELSLAAGHRAVPKFKRSDFGGLSIEYPPDWKATRKAAKEGASTVIDIGAPGASVPMLSVSKILPAPSTSPYASEDPKALDEAMRRSLERRKDASIAEPMRKLTVDGREAVAVTILVVNDRDRMMMENITIWVPGSLWQVYFVYPENEALQSRRLIERMRGSIKVARSR